MASVDLESVFSVVVKELASEVIKAIMLQLQFEVVQV